MDQIKEKFSVKSTKYTNSCHNATGYLWFMRIIFPDEQARIDKCINHRMKAVYNRYLQDPDTFLENLNDKQKNNIEIFLKTR
jgi:hypothetical protein